MDVWEWGKSRQNEGKNLADREKNGEQAGEKEGKKTALSTVM